MSDNYGLEEVLQRPPPVCKVLTKTSFPNLLERLKLAQNYTKLRTFVTYSTAQFLILWCMFSWKTKLVRGNVRNGMQSGINTEIIYEHN